MKAMKTYTGTITTLNADEIFVFGANQDGFHGAGSAGYASFNRSGNVWRDYDYGQKPKGWRGKWNRKGFLGLQTGEIGSSYALVTVTKARAKRSIPIPQLVQNIRELYLKAATMPDFRFYVAQSHQTGLNGYSAKEMAWAFANAGQIPDNIYFELQFAVFIQMAVSQRNLSAQS